MENKKVDNSKAVIPLHLYLGCECVTDSGITGTLSQVNIATELCKLIINDAGQDISKHLNEVKLLLRRVESITPNEAVYLYKMYFGKDTAEDWSGDTGSAYFNPKKVIPTIENALRIIRGDDYSSGDFMLVVSIVPWLLSKSFDLFGLIDSNQAIEKK